MRKIQSTDQLFELGLALAADGNLSEAFEALELVVERDPDHGLACKALARLSLETNEIRAFSNWCHEASRIDPNDWEPYVMMAEHLAARRRTAEAVEAFDAALRCPSLLGADREQVESRRRELAGTHPIQ